MHINLQDYLCDRTDVEPSVDLTKCCNEILRDYCAYNNWPETDRELIEFAKAVLTKANERYA